MRTWEDDEELTLMFARAAAAREADLEAADDPIPRARSRRARVRALERADRLSPWSAGAFIGLLAGAATVGSVQGLDPSMFSRWVGFAERTWQLEVPLGTCAVYGAAALAGMVLGLIFAPITRNLRRWLPLLVWMTVFFTSVAMLAQAALSAYVPFLPLLSVKALFAAALTFAFVLSWQLPLRRRTPTFDPDLVDG